MAFNTVNPFDNTILKTYNHHSLEQAFEQVDAFSESQVVWSKKSTEERGQHLNALAGKLRQNSEIAARLMTKEMGKPITQGRAEIEKCAAALETLAVMANAALRDQTLEAHYRNTLLVPEPYGLVLSIQPWNFPFWQVLRMSACAWMAGNLVILKHSEQVAGCAELIAELCEFSDIKLLCNLRLNHEDTLKLIGDNRIRIVTLTGSTRAGKTVGAVAGQHLKKQVLELGGSDSYIVLEDADLEAAVKTCLHSRLLNSGQSCIAAKRFFVAAKIFNEFKLKYLAGLSEVKSGDPLLNDTQVGPLAAKHFVTALQDQIEKARSQGAIYEVGQQCSSLGENFADLAVLDFEDDLYAFADEEIFAPVAGLYRFNVEDELVRAVNAGPFGLGAAVFSQNDERARQLAKKIQAGTVVINGFVQSDARVPFGGKKDSGLGREMGLLGLSEFVNWKVIGQN